MSKEEIDNVTIKKMIQERNINDPCGFVIIENKTIRDFSDINCKNIILKNCSLESPQEDTIFCNSYIENINIEDCVWHDSVVKNTIFKNITIRRSIIYNNISMENCIFDNLCFEDSLMNFPGFCDCQIKNTNFIGKEYFFLQVINLEYIWNLYKNNKLGDFSKIINQNKDKFCIAWYNMQYNNCVIDLDSIKRLANYSDRIDPNYSDLAHTYHKTGYIYLNNIDQNTKYNLVSNIFLFDAEQKYDYLSKFRDEEYEKYFRTVREKHIPPLFLFDDEVDLSKYRKTLSTKLNEKAMTIVDSEGMEIDKKLIVPLGDISFVSSFYKDSNFVESNYDAVEFCNRNHNKNKVYIKSLWKK